MMDFPSIKAQVTVLSAVGVLQFFVGFLTVLGVTIPPIAGIMVVDYFLLRRHRRELDESTSRGILPLRVENWNPVALLVWVIASVIGATFQWGIPVLNSLFSATLLYSLMMKGRGLLQMRNEE